MTKRRTRLHLDQDYVLLGLIEIVERTLGRSPAGEEAGPVFPQVYPEIHRGKNR